MISNFFCQCLLGIVLALPTFGIVLASSRFRDSFFAAHSVRMVNSMCRAVEKTNSLEKDEQRESFSAAIRAC